MIDIKKYFISQRIYSKDLKITEHPDGDWIEAGDINKIKADALRDCLRHLQDCLTDSDLSDTACCYIDEYADKLESGEV